MFKPVYYICLGDSSSLTYPLDRFDDKALASHEVALQRAAGFPAFILTAGDYRQFTGRSAYADYLKEQNGA